MRVAIDFSVIFIVPVVDGFWQQKNMICTVIYNLKTFDHKRSDPPNDDEWTPKEQHWTSKVQSKTAESFQVLSIGSAENTNSLHWF
jgi:hypothetical protein